MSITTNCVIIQVMQLFRTNCFTFLTEVRMPQVRKSCSCGIFAIFLQCYFMIETQALMTVSDFFLGFFLGIIFGKEASLFCGGCFSDGGGFISFLSGGIWGASVLMCVCVRMEGAPLPHAPQTMGNPSNMDVDVLNPRNIAQVHMAGLYKLKHNLC